MASDSQSISNSSPQSTPWLVLAGMLLVSVIAAGYVWRTGTISAQNQYKYSVNTSAHEIRDAIHDRIDEYVGLLRGAAGLFAADSSVSSAQFHEYVRRLNLPGDYPGALGIGYALEIEPGQTQAVEARRLAQGSAGFHIWPAPKAGASVSAVIYLEPSDAHKTSALGYDIASDLVCLAAMDRARDNAAPAASGKVAPKPGPASASDGADDFIIFVPVYQGGVDPGTIETRRAKLLGFVYCPFSADLLLRGIGHALHGALIDFTVYDGVVQAPEHHLHHTGAQSDTAQGPPIQSQTMAIAGRTWTLAFEARPDLAPHSSLQLPAAVFAVGVGFAGLIFWIIFSQAKARLASERAAGELRRSRAALEQSEASLRRLVQSNLIGVVITDAAGHVIQANNAFLTITGYSRQDLVEGKVSRAALAPAENTDQDRRSMDQLQETGTQPPFEKEYVRQDGSRVPVLVGTTTLHQDHNTAVSFVVDLSELRKARSAVAESERRFRMLVEQSPLGIQIFAPDGHVLLANQAWERLWEAGPADGQYNVLHDPQLEKIGLRPLLTRAFAGESAEMPPFRYDPALSGRPGRPRWVQFHFYPIKDHAGVVREIVLILHDLTEVKEAEEAVARSEEQLRLVIDAIPMLIGYLDHEARFRLSNQLYEEWFELPDGQAEGLLLRQVIGEDAYRIAEPFLERALAGERQIYDRKMQFLDGSDHDLHVTLIPHVGLAGHVEGVVALVGDVTERRQAENERSRLLAAEREARAEAETANRIKDEFLATLSHELRTPLNAILGWAQLLRMGSLPADEVAHGLEAIERNAKVQAQLVEDLLDLSRIISGKLRLEMRQLDLAAVLEAAMDSVRPAAQAKGIELAPTMDSDAGPVLGDAGRLQQVIWNLLSNAIKFTPAGGKVELLLRKVGSQAQIVVTDSGMGIAPDFLPFVFDRLRQADSTTTRRHGGLGLGLAIARHLIESHGGAISVHSEGQNRGASFTVTLPLVLNAAPKASPPEGDGAASAGASTKRCLDGVRVLVVDDEPDARDLVSQVLRRDGAVVRSAASAAEALTAVDEQTPDVLISDIAMPGEDGYELIRKLRLRDASRGGSLPAIALTAFARGEDRDRALRAGFQDHVAKPFEPRQLTAAVAKLAKD